MKRLSILTLCLLPFLYQACSQKKAVATTESAAPSQMDSNSLLWKISGNGLDSPSYLYGTIHVICSKDYFEPAGLDTAFEQTDQLVLEIDITDPALQAESLKYSFLPEGKTLKDYLNEADYQKVDDFFSEEVNIPLSMVHNMKPFLLSSLTILPFVDCAQPDSYEAKFAQRVKADGESVHSLESMAEVMGIIDEISFERQAEMMVQSLEMMEEETFTFQDMIEIYKAQDLKRLDEVMSEANPEGDEFNDLLLAKRNNNWMDDLEGYITDMPSLVAVGAGHLGGENGLIKLLTEKGYTVTPVN